MYHSHLSAVGDLLLVEAVPMIDSSILQVKPLGAADPEGAADQPPERKALCHYHSTLHTRFPSGETRSGRTIGRLLMNESNFNSLLGDAQPTPMLVRPDYFPPCGRITSVNYSF
jgi:hypothetical protein